MKFSIITPTYRRRQLLDRAVGSVRDQSYHDWEMIIVNDSPDDKNYDDFPENYVNDARIRYFVNLQNQGVNYSRNRGLDLLSPDSTHVIFLDDDDYFSPNALTMMAEALRLSPEAFWLVTNRVQVGGSMHTAAPADASFYNYARDYLIGRRIKGDATHCIAVDKVGRTRFPTEIRQAEEWLFYMELGQKCSLYYRNRDTTYTDGYLDDGLSDRRRRFRSEVEILGNILVEAHRRRLFYYPYFYLYYLMRIVRPVVRP